MARPVLPPLEDSVQAFLAGWERQDGVAMVSFFDRPSRARWSGLELEELFSDAFGGAVAAIDVAMGEASDRPVAERDGEAVEATASFTISYVSPATAEPAALRGTMQWSYDWGDEAWVVRWDDSMLWPGITRAAAFEVAYRWPRRAAIVDRRGRPLATGDAARRRYPFGAAGGATIGHLEPGRRGVLVGASGLEAAVNHIVAGDPMTRLLVVDRRGQTLDVLGRKPGRPGRRVQSTLDVEIQRAAEAAYGATTGGAVVMEPDSGDVLAVVSSSPFDPGNYVGVAGISPFNRALSGLYPPGSAMKVVTAAAALDARAVRPMTELTGPKEFRGVRNFESGAFGTLDFSEALTNSVNTAFAQVALKLGGKQLTRYAEAFGFNEKPSMPLDVATSSFPVPEDEGDLMWGSIGQAQVVATPLQMATVAATIANTGKRMDPRIIRGEKPAGERAVSGATAATMTTLMESVVERGTGVAARIAGVRVAGKTGTAEVDVDGKRKNHAWFICFAPADDPKVAVALVSEDGGVGGQVAAPLARSILLGVLPLVR